MINVFGASVGHEEIEELSPSITSGWMGMGRKVTAFEEAFEQHIGAPFVMVDSGSNALYMAVKLLDLPPQSEIIVPSFTWVACAHAVVLCGHKIVFADVDVDTQCIRAEDIDRVRTNNTRAAMVVHYAGKPAEMNDIISLGIPIIEDAAHAPDSRIGGRACGTLGNVGIYSFDAVKNIASPDGGGLTSPDRNLIDRMKYLRYCGIGKSGFDSAATSGRWWEYNIRDFFPKVLPNDVSASIALSQLRKLGGNQERRRKIWNALTGGLSDISWLALPAGPTDGERHSWFTYFVRVLDGRRDALAHYLREKGIYTTLRYHPLHLNAVYGSTASLPNSELLNEQGLNLPLHPALTDDQIELVIDSIRRY